MTNKKGKGKGKCKSKRQMQIPSLRCGMTSQKAEADSLRE
jgi:hypothetical protein